MTLNYLIDENVNVAYAKKLRRQAPNLTVWVIGEPGVPPKGTLDPDILIWCEQRNCVLVTNDRRTMQRHLDAHLAQGHHSPGIFLLNPKFSMDSMIDELINLAHYSLNKEYEDRVIYLPV